ncbi:HAD family hydrolase [Paractinoplanes durhamensis]|uniref:Haloacid dehalogenase n=1 Tax=Paractinoplanes durhamensis TaxID=113563 RepID=A0ABQ3Z2S5_9ACTN|nr:HAD family phosphatase [Actinoplanes durhamensis]GIE04134.1 haloacid dehalogenase [Actinoplanes durhamensis]
MTIRAVVFDIGGVLAIDEPMDFDARWEATLGLAAGTIGTVMADVWAAGAIGKVTEAEVNDAMRDRLRLTAGQVEAIMADMWRQYLGVANTELIEYARGLRPRYRTGILSNSFVGAREREQSAYGLEDLVDDLIYSHEAGMNKPDPALWELACRRFGVEPAEMVFLDNAPRLVDAARDVGIRAVLYESPGQSIAAIEKVLAR